ncbi:hypothetical protein AC578_3641 [Pseudocercospora eumusae]|uniref:Uncharacterized protein n=1 Tax=Pseudocercospora eumusae TaxID=321146 RepID=A0A139HPJ6_9PEZI|nr:hypothetical protein AC578_3641 [Pseudocercospora eumusae]
MPRQVAPPPSGEFRVKLQKPFSGKNILTPPSTVHTDTKGPSELTKATPGAPTHSVEVLGEPNRPASIRMTQYNGNSKSSEKSGDVPKDDVNELMSLVSALRGFPSHPSKDVYGLDTTLDLTTFDIQWGNADEDPAANEINELAAEQKDGFKRIVDSIEALGRTFAKQDSAV